MWRFEAASGGTVFVDEVKEMALALQGKLLRVLQEGAVERLGTQAPIALDLRVVAATNRDPERTLALVQAQKARDLTGAVHGHLRHAGNRRSLRG